jgi:hypothetical protein
MQLLLTREDRRAARRRRLAEGLESAVERAHGGRFAYTAQVPVARDAVLGSEHRLLDLAAVLRSGGELPEQGLAAVRALLTDGGGPLFVADRDLPAALARVERRLGLT